MKALSVTVIVLIVLHCVCCSAATPSAQLNDLQAWICGDEENCITDKTSMRDIFRKFLERGKQVLVSSALTGYLHDQLKQASPPLHTAFRQTAARLLSTKGGNDAVVEALVAAARKLPGATNTSYSYFAFLPTPLAKIVVGGPTITYSSPCFSKITATARMGGVNTVNLTIDYSGQTSLFCTDSMFFWGANLVALSDVSQEGSKTVQFKATIEPSADWYLRTHGIHAMRLPAPLLFLLPSIYDTYLVLAAAVTTPPLPASMLEANINFLRTYIQYSPRLQPVSLPRTGNTTVARNLPLSYLESGDLIAVYTPDGVDPLLAWGDGTTDAHTAMVFRHPQSGELLVIESTPGHDAYWPNDGVQMTPYSVWVHRADVLGMSVLLAPLSAKYRARFNTSAAWEYFRSKEGLGFGLQTVLWGWLDTPSDNFPCVPPDFKTCLNPSVVEAIMYGMDRAAALTPYNLFRQALNHRAGTWPKDYSLNDLLRMVSEKNISLAQLYSMPERDEWLYNTTRNISGTELSVIGSAQVCSVFACSMLKAGGVFAEIDSQINCQEQAPWDVFSMQIFDNERIGPNRHALCKNVDPDNQLCQLLGPLKFQLRPDFNSRPPYAHMGEHCKSISPDYIREPGC